MPALNQDPRRRTAVMSSMQRRLQRVLRELTPAPPSIGQLCLGDITYDVPVAQTPSRLPHFSEAPPLDVRDALNLDNLHFMLQKYLLGQDVFLLSQPGPYARRLALTFCRYVNLRWSALRVSYSRYSVVKC